jgi:hypothetical protein
MDKKTQGDEAANLADRLARHPELMSQIKGLLDEVENQAGGLKTADEAEDALIGRMRKIGQTVLTDWAKRETAKLSVPPPGMRRGSKKKSNG